MPMKWLHRMRRLQQPSTRTARGVPNGTMTTATLLPPPVPKPAVTDAETAAQRKAIDWAWSIRSEVDPAGDLADVAWPEFEDA